MWLLNDYNLSVVDFDIEILQAFTIYFCQPAKENEIATFDAKRLDEETITESPSF